MRKMKNQKIILIIIQIKLRKMNKVINQDIKWHRLLQIHKKKV